MFKKRNIFITASTPLLRIMATMMYPTLTKSQSMRTKRKSAVELLAESKPFYVKSEIVRDTKQALPTRPPSNFATYGTYSRTKSASISNPNYHGTSYRPTTLPQCKCNARFNKNRKLFITYFSIENVNFRYGCITITLPTTNITSPFRTFGRQ